MRAEILVVCGSDACLAPAVAVALRAQLAGTPLRSVVDVVSAGVRGEGVPWCEEAATASAKPFAERARWVHRSRQVNADMVRRAALVLVTERRYRSAIRLLDRHSAPRTFTLAESAALASAVVREGPVARGPRAARRQRTSTRSSCAGSSRRWTPTGAWSACRPSPRAGVPGSSAGPSRSSTSSTRTTSARTAHKRSLARVDAAVHGLAVALTRSSARALVT